MKYYLGSGLINKTINALPFEMHIPGYNYCGPGTKLQKRLERGDLPKNKLDEACREHDIAYSQQKDLKERHEADKILAHKAWTRFKSSDAKIGEKMAALGVSGIMRAKVKLGLGYSKATNTNNKCEKILKKQLKLIEKIKKTVDNAFESVNNNLKQQQIQTKIGVKKSKNNNNKFKNKYRTNDEQRKIPTKAMLQVINNKQQDSIVNEMDTSTINNNIRPIKRKLNEIDNDEFSNKKLKNNTFPIASEFTQTANLKRKHSIDDNDDNAEVRKKLKI